MAEDSLSGKEHRVKVVDLRNSRLEPLNGHTSKGDQPKWQRKGKWYKADHMGYEALAEVVISRLLKKSNVKDFVSYEPVRVLYENKEKNACVSTNFREGNEILLPFERLHRAYHGRGLAEELAHRETGEKIRYTVNFLEQTTGLQQVGKYLTMLLELDAFFLNEDRHTNNLAVIRNEDTKEYRLCPVFDNGLSLLSDMNDYPMEEDIYCSISHVKAKPFDQDFDEQVSAAEMLYGPQLQFSFTRNDLIAALEGLEEYYPFEMIDRVTRILREQIRRYPVYFS